VQSKGFALSKRLFMRGSVLDSGCLSAVLDLSAQNPLLSLSSGSWSGIVA